MPDTGRWSTNGGDPALNDIRQADRFLDALAAGQPVYSTDSAEAELAFLLADWRDGIRDTAVTTPLTARDAVAALQSGLHRKESRGSLAIVGSVAAALLCLGGFGTAVYVAGPGDTLYGLHSAMFGAERVSDEQVMLAAQTQMQEVQQLIDNGQWQQAQDKLQALSPTVQSVDAPEHKQQLIEQWNALTYKVVEQNPAATLPPAGEPLPALPSSPLTLLPVPVIESPQPTTTTTTTATTTTSTSGTSSSSETTTSPSATDSTSSTSSSGTTSAPSSTSQTETSSSESSTASSSASSTTASSSASSTVSTTAPSAAPSTPATSAAPAAPASSSEPSATNPVTAAPSPTQPAQTVTTVAPTVTTPPAAPPAPATKETQQPQTRERSAQPTTSTTEAPSGHSH